MWFLFVHSYCATQMCIARSRVLATATWLAGWLSVTRRYCIKTAKPILKLFRPSGSLIILVFLTPVPRLRNDLYCVEWDVKP